MGKNSRLFREIMTEEVFGICPRWMWMIFWIVVGLGIGRLIR
jgi:hypothetical protein